MTKDAPEADHRAGGQAEAHEVKLGDLECPRCKKRFTMSYWHGDKLIQARCLSCDLKWPRPDVV